MTEPKKREKRTRWYICEKKEFETFSKKELLKKYTDLEKTGHKYVVLRGEEKTPNHVTKVVI